MTTPGQFFDNIFSDNSTKCHRLIKKFLQRLLLSSKIYYIRIQNDYLFLGCHNCEADLYVGVDEHVYQHE